MREVREVMKTSGISIQSQPPTWASRTPKLTLEPHIAILPCQPQEVIPPPVHSDLQPQTRPQRLSHLWPDTTSRPSTSDLTPTLTPSSLVCDIPAPDSGPPLQNPV